MPTPEFIVRLRERVGHDLLWLTGVTAVVEDSQGRILLGRRADTGQWALVYGICEPGEQPADTALREVREETGVDACITALFAVTSAAEVLTYPNGDRAQYMDHAFLCTLAEGGNAAAFVGDDESLSVGWFPPEALPEPLADSTRERLRLLARFRDNAAHGDTHTLFVCGGKLR